MNVLSGEPVAWDEMIEDLSSVNIVYVGERHSVDWHHDVQARLLSALTMQDGHTALAVEMLSAQHQPTLDRYWQGELDFEAFAEATDWASEWKNYDDYRVVFELAREQRLPIVALNAPKDLIRAIAMQGGVAGLNETQRAQLPAELDFEDPAYMQWLTLQMGVHLSATDERMRPMVEAQIARDETMAANLAAFLQSETGLGRRVMVVTGSGHMNYGLGTVSRVRRHLPEATDRLVVLPEAGLVELSPEMQAISQEITITQDQLRSLSMPIADYIAVPDIITPDNPHHVL